MTFLVPPATVQPTFIAPDTGSRRRRLWELAEHAYCPVIGVCLPVASLRRVAAKVLGGEPAVNDYDLHRGVITDCKRRTAMAKAVQRELDRRYASMVRQSATCKHADDLASWWRDAKGRGDLAGALWAVLTHPRCHAELEADVLGDVHMLQHQVGAAMRVDWRRMDELQGQNSELTRELAEQRRRHSEGALVHSRRLEQAQADIMQLRAELIGRDTRIGELKEQLHDLQAVCPDLQGRVELMRINERHLEHIRGLQRELQSAQFELVQARRTERQPAPPPVDAIPVETAPASAPSGDSAGVRLDQHAVLCVGGRQGSVPAYRALVERIGGRFLHHDGGEEDSASKLDATLVAADLVICQTGCLSHAAYWRVKSHCKRTGKRCVFVENPSATSLQRALDALPATEVAATEGTPARLPSDR